jgi:hypothetical protein
VLFGSCQVCGITRKGFEREYRERDNGANSGKKMSGIRPIRVIRVETFALPEVRW